ncbi:MAG: hypothetical protein LBG24_03640 [Treponema sp.]|jgi:thioredoxin reductase|nr:hypothetical protein [Treponema sp.]
MRRQAQNFGAELPLAEAESLDLKGMVKTVKISRSLFRVFGGLLASGAHPRKIGFKGEETFKGRGVAYCATYDGEFLPGVILLWWAERSQAASMSQLTASRASRTRSSAAETDISHFY